MAIIISIGKWGGFYIAVRGYWARRICLGWVAVTIAPCDGDKILDWAVKYIEENKLLMMDRACKL